MDEANVFCSPQSALLYRAAQVLAGKRAIMNVLFPHLSFARLADLADEEISRDERTALMDHVFACPSCASELQRLRQMISSMRTDMAEDAPHEVIAKAVNIFRQRAMQPARLRRIVALLTFDSMQSAPVFGLRSGQTAVRQLLFEAEGTDLDLRLSPQGEEWMVTGQVLSSGCAGGQVELQGEAASETTDLNELCEFKLSAVPSGSYSLRFRLQEMEVEVPQLELGK